MICIYMYICLYMAVRAHKPATFRVQRLAASVERQAQGGWVVRIGGDDEELRPWHYIYVYIIEIWSRISPGNPREGV